MANIPRHAPIQVISTPLDPGEMRYLYTHAGCLVSASRGEGFGLPVAEAMLPRLSGNRNDRIAGRPTFASRQ